MYHSGEADYHMAVRSSAFPCFSPQNLIFLLISDEWFSGKPCCFFFSNSQMRIASRLHRQFSNLVLKSKLVQIKYWKEWWRGPASDDSFMEAHVQCQRKATAPTSVLQAHFQQGIVSERNLIRAGVKVTSRKKRGMAPLFPLSCWHWLCFFFPRARYFTSQKGITTSETNPNPGYNFFYNNEASAIFIFHRKSQDFQELSGSFIKEPKITLALHRKCTLLLKAETNPTQVSLFSLDSRTDLPQNFTGLQLRN